MNDYDDYDEKDYRWLSGIPADKRMDALKSHSTHMYEGYEEQLDGRRQAERDLRRTRFWLNVVLVMLVTLAIIAAISLALLCGIGG